MVNGQYSEANFEGSHGTLQNDGTSVWIDHYAGVHGYHKQTSDQYIGGIKVPPPFSDWDVALANRALWLLPGRLRWR